MIGEATSVFVLVPRSVLKIVVLFVVVLSFSGVSWAAPSNSNAVRVALESTQKQLVAQANKGNADVGAEASSGNSVNSIEVRNRLVVVGLIGGAFLALLGVLFGYLRLEHATRGFYSSRLQLAAIVASAVVLVTTYLLFVMLL